MKVRNMQNDSGRAIPNQFIITGLTAGTFYNGEERLASGDAFQSYESIIVFRDFRGKVYLDKHTWDYSTTTGKYRNRFLGETKRETEKKIKSGEYVLCDLN